jgi:hypothetical protein
MEMLLKSHIRAIDDEAAPGSATARNTGLGQTPIHVLARLIARQLSRVVK